MRHLLLQPDFSAWRHAAREALHAGYTPSQIDFHDTTAPASLSLEPAEPPAGPPIRSPHATHAFLDRAALVSAHRSPDCWNLLYRILYRLQSDRALLEHESDPDIDAFLHLSAQVQRDLNHMQASLRFHKVLRPGDPHPPDDTRPTVLDEPLIQSDPTEPDPHHLVLATPTPFGITRTELEQCDPPPQPLLEEDCEHFIAWCHPDHLILPLAAPHFADRFAILRWTILTPDASASWDPNTHQLTFGPGLSRTAASPEEPSNEELESLWRTYYATLFHTARTAAPPTSQSDLTLFEPQALPMPKTPQTSAAPFVPATHTIPKLQAAMPSCKGCDLFCHATQVVPGRGNPHARLILVGEQPGDQEDLQGLPFVGPAGKLLDRALHELNLNRADFFLTNAVKHFKFVQRGKLRLHDTPRASEINACRPWLLAEIDAIQPTIILCLGAIASRSILGSTFSLMRDRGKPIDTPTFGRVMATIHPSAILRARDDESRHQLLAFLKEDLAQAHKLSAG